ncbi:hypothetical protein H633G_11325 [Metarhizium anisopliae BRIP 53284]|nr:hypothetical protein H633G_11325 [Metarhizium anisopliae BRIP 53284]
MVTDATGRFVETTRCYVFDHQKPSNWLGTKTRTATTIAWMRALFAVAHGSLSHSQGVVAVVLPLVQEGGHENLEGKVGHRYRHDVFGVR